MSRDDLSALLAKLQEDASLKEKFKGAVDADAVVAIARDAGFDVSKDDWLGYQESQVLSDDELEMLAGGMDVRDPIRIIAPATPFG